MSECLEKSVVDYVEMRRHKRERLTIVVKDGKVDALNNGAVEGVCARVLVDKSWGLASTTIIDRKNIEKALREATSLAKASKSAKKREVNLAEVKPHRADYITPMKKDPRKADKEDLVRLVVDTDNEVRSFSKKIASDNVSFNVVDDDLVFLSSEGAQISQRIVRCFGSVMVTAREKGNIASAYESIGEQSGLELIKTTPLNKVGKIAAERADKLVSAKVASGGVFPVILENKIVGLLAHEAVGHCAEADLVHSGSFLQDKIRKKVASNLVTLVDDGRFSAGLGTMMYDDEGVSTEKTVIIDKGVCQSFLHSRETAFDFGVKPTGNARAWDFEYDPIIRMRNTYIEPSDHSLEELVEDMKSGYFLKGGLSGQADFTGEFMFGTQEAVKIRNGRLGESFRGVTICGNAFEVLKRVDAIGEDFIMRAGRCGKEQINYVGMGGASLRTELLLGGN
ncbi:MAG: TldD/PmbA family protein [Candidatus Bathyarchaeota archaeon]|nr:TldD/PmbA family protein [Candidatus Bathyarchaeota archaeon]